MFDHILVVGFGAPEKSRDVKGFVDQLSKSNAVSQTAASEMGRRYEQVGDFSSFSQQIIRLVENLTRGVGVFGKPLPVIAGMRFGQPDLKDAMKKIQKKGYRRGLAVILSSYRSEMTFDAYQQVVEVTKKAAGADFVRYDYIEPWYNHPLIIQAYADLITQKMRSLSMEKREHTYYLFSALSIPETMARSSSYEKEVVTTGSLVAKELKYSQWSVCYQSNFGSREDPWVTPDAETLLPDIKDKEKIALYVPLGSLADDLEVLYSLDVEAKNKTEDSRMEYARTETLINHPKFTFMLLDLIQQARDN